MLEPNQIENAANGVANEADVKTPSRRRVWMRRLALLLTVATFWIVLVGPWRREWVAALPGSGRLAVREPAPAELSERARGRSPGELRVGIATVDVTESSIGKPLAGYFKRTMISNTGIADPIKLRALVVDNGARRVAILSADLLIVNRRLAVRTTKALQAADESWKPDDLYFGATHTHSGPGAYSGSMIERAGLGAPDDDFADSLARRWAEAVQSAASRLEPAEIAHAAVQVDRRLIRNRTKDDGKTNNWLDLVVIRRPGQKSIIGGIAIFSAHATCSPTSDNRLSADYPGVLLRELERESGGAWLFLAGSVGSMAPGTEAAVPREQFAESLGKRLAESASAAIRSAPAFERKAIVATARQAIDLPWAEIKLGERWRISPLAASTITPKETAVNGLRIGSVILLGTPADYSGELALDLRGAEAGMTTVVTSFNGDYIGYILPDDYDNIDKYEPRSMSFFGPRTGSQFQRILTDLRGRLAEGEQ